ncbi:uncharacterized protein LOC108916073 [Anoplophora glabripennis]|uniref:uncharacterized protein LOC108916073 n=1 Tax=Anoplophora glabripennis TaxID=217634 RepID=UPI000873A095|nr:uncharacterized protein LOC108916073 [Anoplophora glabripennis]
MFFTVCVIFFGCRSPSNGMEADETKVRVPSVLWIPLLICGAFLFFVDVFQINYDSLVSTREPIRDLFPEKKFLAGFAINTPGCRIPYMDPFDEHIRKFIEEPKVPKCNKGIPALYQSNLTSIYLVNSSLVFYNITDRSELRCCYSAFWRQEPKRNQNDDRVKYSKECVIVSESVNISEEFIRVLCTYDNNTVYKDMFSFVPLKNATAASMADPKPLNVLVVGLDAVSRLNLHRQMPKTLIYLKQLQVVELLGYNKVADNTFPNLIPVLVGMTEGELRNSCWTSNKDHFDKCPFIWNDYKAKGYTTVYGEDSSWMGLFNYQRKGFTKQPTDYGYNFFSRITEKEIGNEHSMNVDQCEGARMVYKDLLNYISKFVVTMDTNKLPYFGFFWGASLSHDYLNKPKMGDEDYRDFFKNLYEEGHLEHTALIFMSDHGIRWGEIRQTYQGRMEERLPFVIMYLPKWYKDTYQRAYINLMRNARSLTTPFDLHETLKDLLNPFNLTEENLETNQTSRGYSLFREITPKRTCEDAEIASHWCTCQQSLEVKNTSAIVVQAAAFAVEYINEQLVGYAQCANLSVDVILNARLMTHLEHIDGKNRIEDYMITLRTLPGEGIFEVTVRHSKVGDKFQVMGSISRLNLYGKQSSCITDFHLKLYCYCKSLLY